MLTDERGIQKLNRLTSCTVFEIRSPIWGGGRKVVGLDQDRITKHNEITFTYRRKSDGQLSFPDHYYFDGDDLKRNYPVMRIGNTTLKLIPFTDLKRLQRI